MEGTLPPTQHRLITLDSWEPRWSTTQEREPVLPWTGGYLCLQSHFLFFSFFFF